MTSKRMRLEESPLPVKAASTRESSLLPSVTSADPCNDVDALCRLVATVLTHVMSQAENKINVDAETIAVVEASV